MNRQLIVEIPVVIGVAGLTVTCMTADAVMSSYGVIYAYMYNANGFHISLSLC